MEINTWFLLLQRKTKKFKNVQKLWDEIKNQIEAKNGGDPIKYKKDFMKTRFESDDGLPLSKFVSIRSIIIIIRFVFQDDKKYYLKVYLHECVYESVGEL